MSEWEASSVEDQLLVAYHQAAGGRIYTEVPAPWSGGSEEWPDGFSNRYIDAIRLKEPQCEESINKFAGNGHEVRRAVENTEVELIETKRQLNRPVIGQVIAGRDLFEAEYSPASIQQVALCRSTDTALEWVCRRHDIRVERWGQA